MAPSRETSRTSERQPLLAPSQDESPPNKSRLSRLLPRFDTVDRRYRFVPLLGCLIILLNEGEYFVKQVSIFRVIESMHCIEYYEKVDPNVARLGLHIPERRCKADLIQKQVAETNALNTFVRMTCALVGTIPLGYLADKKGRKVVLVLHKLNLMLSCAVQIFIYLSYPLLPARAIFLSGLPAIFGGNFDLGLVMLFASYADVIPDAKQRNTLFFLTTSMQYLAQSVVPLLGGKLYNLDGQGTTSNVALFVSFSFSVAAFLVTFFLFPDTMKRTPKGDNNVVDHDDSNSTTPVDKKSESGRQKLRDIHSKALQRIRDTYSKARVALKNPKVLSILFIVVSVFCTSLGIKATDWYGLLQYPIIKLGWTFGQATFLVSAQALVNLINFAILLPTYNKCAIHFGFSIPVASILIMLLSCFYMIIGSVVMGFSATVATLFTGMVIYTLGTGFPTAAQAFVTDLVDKGRLARVLSALSIMAVAGKSAASLGFPRLFAIGLDSGVEVLKGLFFFVAAGLFIVASTAVSSAWHAHKRSHHNLDELDNV